MISSFLLSQTFVPVISNWSLKSDFKTETQFERFRERSPFYYEDLAEGQPILFLFTLLFQLELRYSHFSFSPGDIPKVDAGQFQVRLRLPTGTRIERTEDATKSILSSIENWQERAMSLLRPPMQVCSRQRMLSIPSFCGPAVLTRL